MKHKLVVILSVAAILAAGTLSVVRYEHYRNWRDVQSAKAKASLLVRTQVEKAQAEKRASELNKLNAQCAKDHQLFVDTKGKSAAGDCDPTLQLVQ
jgi:UDP-3-O-[3-hydroxymyristoyl] glucosamine N-acyltransferase